MWSHILKLIGKCTDVKQLEIMRKGVIDAYHGTPSLEMISGYVSHSRAGELLAAIDKRIEYLSDPNHVIEAFMDLIKEILL